MNHPSTPEHPLETAGNIPGHTTVPRLVVSSRAELLTMLSTLAPETRSVRVHVANARSVGSEGHTLRRELAELMRGGKPMPAVSTATQVVKQRGDIQQLLTHLTNLMQLAKQKSPFRTTNIRLTADQLRQLKNHEVAALHLRISQCLPLGVFGDEIRGQSLLALVQKEYNRRQGVDDDSDDIDEDTVDLSSRAHSDHHPHDGSITRTMRL